MKARRQAARPSWPKKASIFEVGPRDGLQSEGILLGVSERAQLIEKLIKSGLTDIEVGSFVKAERIPQLQNTAAVIAEVRRIFRGQKIPTRFWAFIPNEFGLNQGIESDIDGASFFVATSDTFCQKNVNRTQKQILEDLGGLFSKAKKAKVRSRVYLSTLVHCPYEGAIAPSTVEKLASRLFDMGASEVVLSDTTGHATPLSLRKVLEKVVPRIPAKSLALHLHDTRGLALANILESLNFGLARFDSSIGGMGGCPYAPGASGNLATEDLLYFLQGLNLEKTTDPVQLAAAGFYAESLVGRHLPSRVLRTFEIKV